MSLTKIMTASLVASSLLLSTGCVSPMHKAVEKIHPGMTKGDVVEQLGSPNYKRREHGKDIWIYTYYQQDKPTRSFITIHHGEVTEVSDKQKRYSLLEQAKDANTMEAYEAKIKQYQEAQTN